MDNFQSCYTIDRMENRNSLAPIVVFAFNRLEPLKACISALLTNTEAADSDLIVFVDGPRDNKEGEKDKVEAVREYVKTITGFKSLTCHFSEKNKKLGPSIIAGVTEVINQYGRAIVVEDDLIVGRNFLCFMNQCLDKYKNKKEVWSVCGYTSIVKIPSEYPYSIYFCARSSSWGWATWKDRWDSVDWLLEDWGKVKKNARAFNKWAGSDSFGILKSWKDGRNQSWATRFCYNQFVQNKWAVFPVISHVDNEGFDGSGTNCKGWSRFKSIFDQSSNKKFYLPEEIIVNKSIYKDFLKYHSIPIRIYSRIMYMIYGFKSKYSL